MTIRLFTVITLMAISPSISAQIYQCKVNGNTEYSDIPCTGNEQEIELQVYQPTAEDIVKQRQTTKSYQRESRYVEVEALTKNNKQLKQQIAQLQKQYDAELQVLQKKTYRYSDTHIAATEPGLFKKMRILTADYQARIRNLENEIAQNEQKIARLQLQQQR